MIKVLLVDDHKIVRDGLRTMLNRYTGVEVVGEAENGRDAIQLAKKLSPNIIIMDIAIPDLNGIEATREIIAENPGVKVIALSMHSDRRYISAMFRAGASGFLQKQCAFEEMMNAIQKVKENKTYISPEMSDIVVDDFIRNSDKSESSVFSVLSSREREVLQLLAEGRNSKEIASNLNVSIKTVDAHRAKVMSKLGIHSVAELTKYAVREGLTSL